MSYQEQIDKLKASVVQIATLPHGRFNSFTEESRMDEILIILTEIDRLESLQKQKISVHL